jgi:crotonobetainyl-CoA:carnitine CoA-transferase CaiB-like acyl-CoA transferase
MELVGVLTEIFATKTSSEWAALLHAADVPHAPVLDYAALAEHEQFWANGYLREVEHATLGKMRVHGPPVRMSKTPAEIQGGGPQLAQHTEEVLLELGYTWEQIEALNRKGVTAFGEPGGK